MSENIFIILGMSVALIAVLFVYFLFFKKKKKAKNFSIHYFDDVKIRDTKIEDLDFEQVSIDHFNTAAKGLKQKQQKLEEKKENKLTYKTPTPKMW